MSGLGLSLSLSPFLALTHFSLPLSFYVSQFIFLSHSFTPPDGVFLSHPVTQLNVFGLSPFHCLPCFFGVAK